MLTLTPVSYTTTTSPLTFDQFNHHMNFVVSSITHARTLNDLYASDPTYFGSSLQDPAPALDHILALISSLYHLPAIIPQEVPSPTHFTILDAWVYNFDCGASFIPGSFIDESAPASDTTHRAPDLTTIQDLYTYITYVYFRELDKERIQNEELSNP